MGRIITVKVTTKQKPQTSTHSPHARPQSFAETTLSVHYRASQSAPSQNPHLSYLSPPQSYPSRYYPASQSPHQLLEIVTSPQPVWLKVSTKPASAQY